MLRKLFCLFAIAQLCAICARSQTLYVNNVKAVRDVNTHIFYATADAIPPDSTYLQAVIHLDANVATIKVDGTENKNGSNIKLKANMLQHELVFKLNEKTDTLQLALTTLPLVTINRVNADETYAKGEPILTTFQLYTSPKSVYSQGEPCFTSWANISYRGATASQMPKKSFKVNLLDKADDGKFDENDRNLLSIRTTNTYLLDAASIDYSRIRNRVCFDLWNELSPLRDADMKRNGTVGRFCEMLLDGRYVGLYCLSDNINRKLLGLKKLKEENGNKIVRGILYKCKGVATSLMQLQKDESLSQGYGERWYDWFLKYPDDASVMDERCWTPLYHLLDHTSELGQSPDSVQYTMQNFRPEFIETYAVFAMSLQLLDNMMHNTYLSVKDCTIDERMWLTPWDMDGSFGRDGSSTKFNIMSNSYQVFQNCHPFRYFYDNKVEPFYSRYIELWDSLHSSTLSVEHVAQVLHYYTQQIECSGSWLRECARWSGMKNFWHPNVPLDLAPSLTEEVNYMLQWYEMNENQQGLLFQMVPSVELNSKRINYIYHIDGRLCKERDVQKLPSGIYIINGRKVIK